MKISLDSPALWQQNRLHILTIDPIYQGNYFPTLLKYRNVSIGSINEPGGAYGWCACAVTLEVGCSKFVGQAGYHLPYIHIPLVPFVQEGAAAEQHIIIGTVMATISHGRFSPSPGSFSFLPELTAGQPAGRERMRMRNRVDWIKSSRRLRSDAGQHTLHFLWKKFPPS